MTRVNLIPDGVLLTEMRRRRIRRWAVLVLSSTALAAVPVLLDWSRAAQAAQLRNENDRVQHELGEVRNRLRTTTAEATKLHLEIERARALQTKRAWSGMFALIASCLPDDCWLASVATDPEAPPAGAPPRATAPGTAKPQAQADVVTIEAPRKLRIVGYAENDTPPLAFVTKLKESQVFRSVLLERAMRSAKGADDPSRGPVYEFEVVCEW